MTRMWESHIDNRQFPNYTNDNVFENVTNSSQALFDSGLIASSVSSLYVQLPPTGNVSVFTLSRL